MSEVNESVTEPEEVTENKIPDAIDAMSDTIEKHGPAYLVAQAGRLYGTGNKYAENESVLATQLTQYAFDLWGLEKMLEYASNALLVDINLVTELVAAQTDLRVLLNTALVIKGIDVDELFCIFYENHKGKEDMEIPLEQITFLYFDAVAQLDPEYIADWIVGNDHTELVSPLLRTHRIDESTRKELFKVVSATGTWRQKAELCILMPNAVSKNIREQVAHNSVDEEEEIKTYATQIYSECDGDVHGIAEAIKILHNEEFTAQMETMAKMTWVKMVEEAGGLENMIGGKLPTKLATAVKNAK